MHSPSAITEHVSLNLAGFFSLDPVYQQKSFWANFDEWGKKWTNVDMIYACPHRIASRILKMNREGEAKEGRPVSDEERRSIKAVKQSQQANHGWRDEINIFAKLACLNLAQTWKMSV